MKKKQKTNYNIDCGVCGNIYTADRKIKECWVCIFPLDKSEVKKVNAKKR